MSRPFARSSRSSSPPSLFAPSTTSSSSSSPAPSASLSSRVDAALAHWQQLGLHLRRSWLVALAKHIQSSSPASLVSVDAFTKAVYPFILSSSFNSITRPTLPAGLASAHRRRLPSQHILLVLSSINTLAAPSSTTATPYTRRLLKLTLTDGWQLLAAIEVRNGVASLPAAGVKGYKVAVRDVEVWRGVMLLDDTNTVFLGGHVRDDEEEETRSADGAVVVADGWDGKGAEEYKQPPPAAPPFPQSSSAARSTTNFPISSSVPPSTRPPPPTAPYAPPHIQPNPPQPRIPATLPASLPPLEYPTQYQPSDSRTSSRAADERKANTDVSYTAAADVFALEDERMHDFYAEDDMDSEDVHIQLSADSDRPAVSPPLLHGTRLQSSHSSPPLSHAAAPFVRSSTIRAAAADGSGVAAPTVAVSSFSIPPSSSSSSSSSLLSSSSAVADARYGTSVLSSSIAAVQTSYTVTHTSPPASSIAASHTTSSHSLGATPPLTTMPTSSSTATSASASTPSSVVSHKKKARPHVDDPFYLPSTALSQDNDVDEQDEEAEDDTATAQPEHVKREQHTHVSDGIAQHAASATVVVEKAANGPVAMIEHDISGPEELAEAHHYLMQAEERDKQKQASDSLPPLEEVDDYYETKEDPAATVQHRATVDVIALDDSDDDVLEAASSGTSNSSPPNLTAHTTTPDSAPLCTADCPFTYIDSLLRLLAHFTGPPRLFLVKGYLVSNSHSTTWPAFSMQVLVDDGSGSVECSMDGRLLETAVFCCTPQQLVAASGEEQARRLKEAEKRVVLMEGFMVVRVAAGCLPVLLSVHEPDMATVTAVMVQRERERER